MKKQIIHGDCLEIMKGMADKSVDLVLTDPPYGMSYQSSRRTDKFAKIELDDNVDWFADFIKECYRILKDDRHIYVFCNDYAISTFRDEMKKVGFVPKRTLVWLKNNHTSGDLEGDYGNKTEFVLYAQKGRRELNGKRDTNVLEAKRVCEMSHPTQKPIDLFSYLIEKSSKENEIVFDPFAGSCTTAIAAAQLNRNYICIEKEEQYINVCHERMDNLQNTLL